MFFTLYWLFFISNCCIVLVAIIFDKQTPIDQHFVIGSAVIITTSLAGTILVAYYSIRDG